MDFMTVTGAAAALGIDKSVLSRYVAANPELNRGEPGGRPAVDFEQLKAHRAEHVDPARQNSYRGGLMGDDGGPDADAGAGGDDYRAAKTRVQRAAAERAELDLGERRRDLVDRSRVEAGFQDGGQGIRQALKLRNRALGERLARETDPREIMRLLDDSDRELLDGLADRLEQMAGEPETELAA